MFSVSATKSECLLAVVIPDTSKNTLCKIPSVSLQSYRSNPIVVILISALVCWKRAKTTKMCHYQNTNYRLRQTCHIISFACRQISHVKCSLLGGATVRAASMQRNSNFQSTLHLDMAWTGWYDRDLVVVLSPSSHEGLPAVFFFRPLTVY